MGVNSAIKKIIHFVSKYRYPVLVLLIGVVLMLVPARNQSETEAVQEPVQTESIEQISMEDALEAILKTIDGAGEVEVLLSVAAGEEIVYQVNEDRSASEDTTTTQITTITVETSDKSENGLVQQINPPIYRGAVISCQGADNASVRLAIVDAVSKVTGLGTDRIAVLKMK